jgi:hypothetical protein
MLVTCDGSKSHRLSRVLISDHLNAVTVGLDNGSVTSALNVHRGSHGSHVFFKDRDGIGSRGDVGVGGLDCWDSPWGPSRWQCVGRA